MDSLIQKTPAGAGYINSTPETNRTVVVFQLQDNGKQLLETYSMLVTELHLTHSDRHSAVSTLGKDIYLYATGTQPVNISLTGTVIHDVCTDSNSKPPFEELFYEYSVLHRDTSFKMLLEKETYHVYLTGCTRQLTSSENTLADQFRLQLIGVRDG